MQNAKCNRKHSLSSCILQTDFVPRELIFHNAYFRRIPRGTPSDSEESRVNSGAHSNHYFPSQFDI